MSPLAAGRHQRPSSRLWTALDSAAPEGFEVLAPVNVRVGPGRILIPDIVVVATPGVDVVMSEQARDEPPERRSRADESRPCRAFPPYGMDILLG